MARFNLGAVRLPLLAAAVLAYSVAPLSAQVVEKGRTFADLTASHPCSSGYTERIARVTDCDAADDVGDGGGAFQCWVRCDGTAPWETVAIGGGAGGGLSDADYGDVAVSGSGTALTVEALRGGAVTVAATTGNLQWEGTTADAFEGNFTFADPTADWTWAWGAAGDLVGAGSLSIDNLKLDGNTLSSTDTNGNINLTPNGTGQVGFTAGSLAKPSMSFTGDPDTGFAQITAAGSNWLDVVAGAALVFRWDSNGARLVKPIWGDGQVIGAGVLHFVSASTAGVGAPQSLNALSSFDTQTNQGSTAKNYKNLPAAAAGITYPTCVQDSDGIRLTAVAGDTIRQGASVTASGGYIESTTLGACITLQAINADEWFVLSTNDLGTNSWTFN